jgi:hypothetical protein
MISRCTGAKILIGMIGFFGHDWGAWLDRVA